MDRHRNSGQNRPKASVKIHRESRRSLPRANTASHSSAQLCRGWIAARAKGSQLGIGKHDHWPKKISDLTGKLGYDLIRTKYENLQN